MIKELNELFLYIKTIYFNDFSKYMTNETKKNIIEMNDVIELNEELTFKTLISDKLCFNLNLKKYISENELKSENSLADLNDNSKEYIKNILKYEDNVLDLIKGKLLEKIILLFLDNKDDVVTIGTSKLICEYLSSKYKLKYENIIPSKEKEVANFVKEIVGEDTLYYGVVNKDNSVIEEKFNMYTEDNNYIELIQNCNKEYKNFHQKFGKVSLQDSLYEYEMLDYNIQKKSELIKEQKEDDSIMKLKRLSSVKRSLLNISSHKLLFNVYEQAEIKNNIIEINKIMKKIIKNQEIDITGNINDEFPKIINIENESKKFTSKIWSNFVTPLSTFSTSSDFNFIVSKNIEDDIIEAKVISSDMLKDYKTSNIGYGYILEPLDESVIYASSKEFNYHKNNDNYIVDNQEESPLITPNMILDKNLKNKNIENMLLLNKKRTYPVGIFCFIDNEDLEQNSNYLKATELNDDYDLPILTINSYDYATQKVL